MPERLEHFPEATLAAESSSLKPLGPTMAAFISALETLAFPPEFCLQEMLSGKPVSVWAEARAPSARMTMGRANILVYRENLGELRY